MTTIIAKDTHLAAVAARILHGVATRQDLDSIGRDNVLAVKTDNSAVHYVYSDLGFEKADGEKRERGRKFIASSERRDRMGDVIVQRGWRFDNFARNPIALAYHDHGRPIGTVYDWKVGRKDGVAVLRESIDFATADVLPLGDELLRAVDAKVLRATSVGFLPIKAHWMDDSDREKYGIEDGDNPYGTVFEESDQLELSVCTVPAHPDALADGKALVRRMESETWALAERGEISDATARMLCEMTAKALDVSTRTVVTVPKIAKEAAADIPADNAGAGANRVGHGDVEATKLAVEALLARVDALEKRVLDTETKVAQIAERATNDEATAQGGDRAMPRHDYYEHVFAEVAGML
jgi:hypothetical protein